MVQGSWGQSGGRGESELSSLKHCCRVLYSREMVVDLGPHGLPEAGGAVQGGGGVPAEDAQGGDPPGGAEDLHLLPAHVPPAPGDPARGGRREQICVRSPRTTGVSCFQQRPIFRN